MDPLAEIEKIVNEDEFSKLSDVAAIDKVNELIKSAKNIGNFRAYDEAQKIMLDQRSFMYESIKALYDLQNNKTDSQAKKTKMTLEICDRKEKTEKEFLKAAAAFREEEQKLNGYS